MLSSQTVKAVKSIFKKNYRPDHVEKVRVNFHMGFVCKK